MHMMVISRSDRSTRPLSFHLYEHLFTFPRVPLCGGHTSFFLLRRPSSEVWCLL
jgi:hypothetical protein